ncbi:MAG: CDP-diacylglycerol--glycerol-3-phosphate 3-phosphatidyltransferase [Planctomycetota bacterium]
MDSATPPAEPEAPPPVSPTIWNVPNRLSAARIVLAIGCFVALAVNAYLVALVLFVLAAATDWLDGYWARRFNQITQLGRILDPFADKLIVCGVFIYLAAIPPSGVAPWMAVVVMAREMLVTALRGFVEQSGGDFSAKWAGKWKMVFQSLAIVGALVMLSYDTPSQLLVVGSHAVLWIAIALTLYSGWGYIRSAAAAVMNANT